MHQATCFSVIMNKNRIETCHLLKDMHNLLTDSKTKVIAVNRYIGYTCEVTLSLIDTHFYIQISYIHHYMHHKVFHKL